MLDAAFRLSGAGQTGDRRFSGALSDAADELENYGWRACGPQCLLGPAG